MPLYKRRDIFCAQSIAAERIQYIYFRSASNIYNVYVYVCLGCNCK